MIEVLELVGKFSPGQPDETSRGPQGSYPIHIEGLTTRPAPPKHKLLVLLETELRWGVRQRATATAAATWATKARARAAGESQWRVRAHAGSGAATRWATRARVAADARARWRVDDPDELAVLDLV